MTFTEDFERRLRAVLALKTGRKVPAESPISIATGASGSDDDSRGLECWIEIVAMGDGFFADYTYDEPDAWLRLLADMEAIPPHDNQ